MTFATTIPSHWQSGNIRRFAEMKSGHTPSRSVLAYWENTEIPWFTLADVWQLRDGKQIYLGDTANKINELGLANSAAELLPAGTVVLSRTASVGFSGVMPRPMATSQDFWNWVCGPELIPEYLNYQFKSMTAEFKSLNMGSTHQTIYQKDAATLRIVVPPLEEQRAIADYLDRETVRIDTLIEEQQRLIEMLRERRRAAVEEAVSTVATSGARLKHVIRSVRQGWSPQCYSWPADGVETWAVLKAGAANGGRFRPMENKELPEEEIPRPAIVVTRGDLIVSRANTRELVGSAAVVEGDFPRLMLCDKLYAFSLDESRAESRFVAAVLGSRRWRDLIELEATGASHSMLNISQSDIVNLPMSLPPVDEQRRVVARLNSETAKIDQLIAETERFIELARERRAALITAAVTAQIDVREMM
ncbi:restriction endonuclease subunit S [Amycolatopsis sp. NPDC049252]|uniref:restriction endonuclease subunit S n=1 Tax=Amycolatopsis sp. NPDC049252 TaxID=3363933 RepID=UPI00371855FF